VQEFYEAAQLLPTASEETIQLAVLDGVEMTYLADTTAANPSADLADRAAPPATVTATGKARSPHSRRGSPGAPCRHPRTARDDVHSLATVDALRDDLQVVRERGMRWTTRRPSKGRVLRRDDPGRRPWEGPYAASITLLKARRRTSGSPC
jgi:DNA-binding IclR family transcriptional regulator